VSGFFFSIPKNRVEADLSLESHPIRETLQIDAVDTSPIPALATCLDSQRVCSQVRCR
jgi:hypothetical protein